MKTKTSVALAEDVLAGLERNQDDYPSRSDQINTYLRAYIKQVERAKRDAHDLAIINANADKWNAEMKDFLDLQEW